MLYHRGSLLFPWRSAAQWAVVVMAPREDVASPGLPPLALSVLIRANHCRSKSFQCICAQSGVIQLRRQSDQWVWIVVVFLIKLCAASCYYTCPGKLDWKGTKTSWIQEELWTGKPRRHRCLYSIIITRLAHHILPTGVWGTLQVCRHPVVSGYAPLCFTKLSPVCSGGKPSEQQFPIETLPQVVGHLLLFLLKERSSVPSLFQLAGRIPTESFKDIPELSVGEF